jgi:large subunit ribosomal protein L21
MKIAVLETGGKQYLVSDDKKIQVEKLPSAKGETFVFNKVLLISDGKKTEIGKPYLEGKQISGEIVEQKRLRKVTTLKYKSKTRYRRKKGHRQHVTVVKIKL